MAIHKLKVWEKQFDALATEVKKFEYRQNDRDFKAGDMLLLKEYDSMLSRYTGRELRRMVTYVLYGPDFMVPPGCCVMSVAPVDEKILFEECVFEGDAPWPAKSWSKYLQTRPLKQLFIRALSAGDIPFKDSSGDKS